MPWYAWLIILFALGSIVGALLMLRDSAKKFPLTEEQRQRVQQRKLEMEAKDAREDARNR